MSKLKLISVADTQYSASLLTSINEGRQSGLFCDVTIIVQDRKFLAHKCVLSASSSYFRQLFSVAGQVIELNFIKADTFDVVLNYIYTSKIYRVRSDRLEDLISAGQTLGVPFIANLAVPLAQVKGLPGLSKEGDNSVTTSGKHETGGENLPIITETFSLSAEEFNMGGYADKDVDSDGDDVLFVSQSKPQKGQNSKLSVTKNNNKGGPPAKKQKQTEKNVSSQDGLDPDVTILSSPETSSGSTSPPVRTNPKDNLINTTPLDNPPTHSESTSVPFNNDEMFGVQRKKVILEHLPDQPGKIKLSDVSSTYVKNTVAAPATNVVAGFPEKKTIPFENALEIDSLSPGCKVYANIGENTYDIVPEKDPGDESQIHSRSPNTSNHSPKGRKKYKPEQGDHYELLMDGKTFYVCIVCKRPYVSLTSLRRHYNTHSWERKYPCHYCSKVFALAEYRTKHEICHTGERRYQCLLCQETFINYAILSTHLKQMHNQDPSGRKKKDDASNNLYQLLPCKTLQIKSYSFVTDNLEGSPRIPVPEKDSNDHKSQTGESKVDWQSMFAEPENRSPNHSHPGPHTHSVAQIHPQTKNEFEFVIPQTY